jgi:hypothetical protein
MKKKPVDREDLEMIRFAEDLLTNVLKGSELFKPGSKAFSAGNDAIGAFDSALTAVYACGPAPAARSESLAEPIKYLEEIRTVVRSFGKQSEREKLSTEDLKKARNYLDCWAGLVVAELNRPTGSSPSRAEPSTVLSPLPKLPLVA